jgi:hypothetical protein
VNAQLRRAGWLMACALTACFLQTFFRQPVALPLALAVALAVVLTVWRPFPALVTLAALGPLATIIFIWGRGEAGHVQFAETMVLAYLAGWAANRVLNPAPLQVPAAVRYAALLLSVAAVASGIVHWYGLRAEMPDQPVAELLQVYVFREYSLRPPGIGPVAGAVTFASGMLLMLAGADACAGAPDRRRRVMMAMAGGGAAAALFNVMRVMEVAERGEHPLSAFFGYLVSIRVNVHYADKNAAGSYFALALLLAVGLIHRHRLVSLVTAAVLTLGLWINGSRVALAATLIALAGLAVMHGRDAGSRRSRTVAAVSLVVLFVLGAALWTWYPPARNFAASKAMAFRVDLARAGLEMAADAPVFGVGLGRFYDLSEQYAAAALARLNFSRENAHNNFVQILAELGVPGLLAFLVLTGAALRQGALGEQPRPLHVTALLAGICAYLLTALGGHPLIVPEAAYPFWIALGTAAAPFGTLRTVPVPWRIAAAVAAVLLVATIPWRATHASRTANLEHVSTGFSMWQRTPDGVRYRWVGGRATFYVAADAKAVRIPLRSGIVIGRAMEVTVLLEGREANRLLVPADDQWRTLRIVMRGNTDARFTRVDLLVAEPGAAVFDATATADSGIVMVGRPEIER